MSAVKRDSFRSGPKTIKRIADVKADKYSVKRTSKKEDEFREERHDSHERRPAPRSHGIAKRGGYEKREREPMLLNRMPASSPTLLEPTRGHVAAGSSMPPVTAYKLRKGFEAAKAEITETVDEIARFLSGSRHVREIELAVSFSTEGKFLGFGPGGAAIIKLRINPADL